MNKIDQSLLDTWNMYGHYVSYAIAGVGLLILISHYLKLLITKEYKVKYDYINMYEINLLWYSALLIIIAGAVYANTLVTESGILWFVVRLFVSTMFAIIAGVIVQNILKFYYPFYIEKRLKHLRFTPRISPDGRKMKLLSEEEEDVYLDEGMQAEEDAFSVDYDVWIDEESGFTKIEKYNGRLHALKCSECNYQTLKVNKEEIVQSPTTTEEGELVKFFTCGYCGHKEKKSFSIAKLRDTEEVAS
ncbi:MULTISPECIES: hypothetical protein [Reichenbachiella]|uniref:Uncharacterized conserved protein, Tic20 family n=1 Tax=Reichenbachiella agariperforans TaxID=156994 RepID=A0A1M6NPS4_REIAG|nr:MULTISPECIES: hypothetical protein [Reichenbachiella]MBU2915980.1 hypothetical protein [Reichenbachiella agariperforans]RJE71781.1 hypothetical protein BGP76_06745 [Reichenbachiella sp. MSK19-1]SHJ97658.1 Uncharacterized conserved protein, Tic20 family [Reichenbachiella agariperforans]